MVRRAKSMAGAVSLGLVLLAAGPSKAGQVTFSVDFNVPEFGTTYDIQQFDPTLGTLMGIQVVVTSDGTVGNTVEFSDLSSGGNNPTQATVGADLGAVGPGFTYSDSPTISEFLDLQTDGRAFITNDAQIDPGSFDILSNYFGAYEGTGMIGLTLGLSPFATSSNGNVDVIPLSPAQWSGEIDVIYAYSVPEPSSIAMLPVGIGFMLACLARRRKKRPGPRGLADSHPVVSSPLRRA